MKDVIYVDVGKMSFSDAYAKINDVRLDMGKQPIEPFPTILLGMWICLWYITILMMFL